MTRKKPKWRRFEHPWPGQWFAWGDVRACVSSDDGLWHLSISCAYRYPTWDEIYAAWYDLVPGAGSTTIGAIILPTKAEYVNLHPNCFHVYQLAEAEIPKAIIQCG